MDGNAASSQVAHAEDCTYHISAQVIEHQDLPYRPAVRICEGGVIGSDAAVGAILVIARGRLFLVEIEDFLYGYWRPRSVRANRLT